MKNAFKQTYLLFLALSLTLILVDCNYIGNAFSNLTITTERECSDLPDNSHHSNKVCFEDEILISDSKVKPTENFGYFEIVPILSAQIKSRFITSIWQPPKLS
jgi:hypothetical protein